MMCCCFDSGAGTSIEETANVYLEGMWNCISNNIYGHLGVACVHIRLFTI